VEIIQVMKAMEVMRATKAMKAIAAIQNMAKKGGPFEGIYLQRDGLLLYGLTIPLLILGLVSLFWNPSTSAKNLPTRPSAFVDRFSKGEANVKKWTIICFVIPLFVVFFSGSLQHFTGGRSTEKSQSHFDLLTSILMSFMSVTGYGAIWALAVFLIPVTKHSPILDWLHVTPVQALAFHRIAGWISLWMSIFHGFLHLKHLMYVLNSAHPNPRPWYEELWILVVPPSWECIGTQNPFAFMKGIKQVDLDDQRQCWLALVNATGTISTLAFALLAITSLPRFRRSSYDLFYAIHIPCAWIMLFMAIWHYPSCALVLVPNIIYYLSFNVPVYVTQKIQYWMDPKSSSLVEANLIKDGIVELVFATSASDHQRHESLFARLSHPGISDKSHPFSVYAAQALTGEEKFPVPTTSILMKPTGPFTKDLVCSLFPQHSSSLFLREEGVELSDPLNRPRNAIPPQSMIQLESFYASSFDWIDSAMLSHDRILLVAGGVGIVPFLSFLPSLQERISIDATTMSNKDVLSGPQSIELHWYCRSEGLGSYIWHKYLQHHIENSWESNPNCQGRLKIHLHLTSCASSEIEEKELLDSVPAFGLVEKLTYVTDEQSSSIRPIKDAIFMQSWFFSVLLPGFIMTAGCFLHWWWYKYFIIADEFRMDNLVMRSHAIVFTFIVAVLVSVAVAFALRYRRNYSRVQDQDADIEIPTVVYPEVNESTAFVHVSKGRPSVDSVVCDVLKARRPGIYMCGPHSLMDMIENSISNERKACAFYREDSEM